MKRSRNVACTGVELHSSPGTWKSTSGSRTGRSFPMIWLLANDKSIGSDAFLQRTRTSSYVAILLGPGPSVPKRCAGIAAWGGIGQELAGIGGVASPIPRSPWNRRVPD